MPAWPLSLPEYPLRAGLQISPADTVIRSQSDVGPFLTRQRTATGDAPISCQVKLGSLALKDVLDAFFRVDCKGGALSFTWPGLSGVSGGGTGDFKFTTPPSYAPEGAQNWRVSLRLVRVA